MSLSAYQRAASGKFGAIHESKMEESVLRSLTESCRVSRYDGLEVRETDCRVILWKTIHIGRLHYQGLIHCYAGITTL